MKENEINIKGLLAKIFIPSTVLISVYLLLGYFCTMPHLLLFCILGTIILVPIELGIIMCASKKESGTYSIKSALVGQKKLPLWQVLIIAFTFFGIAGLISVFIAPIEDSLFAEIREATLNNLSVGFDWSNYEYLKSFSRPMLILTCVYYGIFNVLIAPITEELFFRGYLTSHYQKQSSFVPILITVFFSLYHFWLPFNNIFRILAFTPVSYVSYRKRNLYISLCFHCFCNLFSTISYTLAVLG